MLDKKEYMKIYRKENKDKIRRQTKQYRKKYNRENKEKIKLYKRKYDRDHQEIYLKSNLKQLKKYGDMFNMNSNEYSWAIQSWSKTIKKRDRRKCKICNSAKNINAHHIFQKNIYPQLSLNINNGVTLCKKCHGKTHGFEIYEGRR